MNRNCYIIHRCRPDMGSLTIHHRNKSGRMAAGPNTGRTIMLTRRGFAGFASCALCGITEFVAAEASAQGAAPAASGGVTRKILSQTDGPTPGYVTLLVEATIEAGGPGGGPPHPGIESASFLWGGFWR